MLFIPQIIFAIDFTSDYEKWTKLIDIRDAKAQKIYEEFTKTPEGEKYINEILKNNARIEAEHIAQTQISEGATKIKSYNPISTVIRDIAAEEKFLDRMLQNIRKMDPTHPSTKKAIAQYNNAFLKMKEAKEATRAANLASKIPTTVPDLTKLSDAAKATPGKPITQVLQSGGKIIGKVVVVYISGKFVYDFYTYDGNGFQKTINAANNITYIPFTPDFSGITQFALKGPEYLKQQAMADLVQKMTALNDCLNRWETMKNYNIIVQCAPSSFLGADTTRWIKNEADAKGVRDDLKYYQDLYPKRINEK